GLLDLFVQPTEPYVLLPLIALITLLCALGRHWRGALLCVAGTAIPVALNSWVLKPLFDRHLKDYLAYPSGHTVSLVAVLTVLVLLARPGTGRLVSGALAVLVTAVAGVGLVGLGYHYPIDVAGGALFAVAAVLGVSLSVSFLPVPRRAPERSDGSPPGGTSSGNPPAASPR
ncbi:phosphatase PAP2 family protein, partial [Amycolatopsis rhizosphaerae]